MNNVLRKIIAGLLSATMIFSGLGSFPIAMSDLFVYASSDDDDGDGKDHSDKTSQWYQYGAGWETFKNTWYVLEVSTGKLAGTCCKDIVITYKDQYDRSHQQVLTPGRMKADFPEEYIAKKDISSTQTLPYLTSYYAAFSQKNPNANLSDDAVYALKLKDQSDYARYTGSRFTSFNSAITNKTGFSSATTAQGNFSPELYYANVYSSYISTGPEYDTAFPKIVTKITETAPFAAFSTEQLLFCSEFGIKTLESVAFICEGTGNEDWTLNGWSLYSISSEDLKNINISSSTFRASDMTMDYSGKLVASAVSDDIGFVNFGRFEFLPAGSETKNGEQTFTNGGNVEKSSSRKILNFSINLMDTEGAGVECFNKAPLKDAQLYITEMLTAVISYTDTEGISREISLPVFTNAVMDFAVDESCVANSNASSLSNCELLSFAQQGESIVFSVALNNFKTLDSMELTYKNNLCEEDSILVEDITVYDNWGDTTGAKRESYTYYDIDSSTNKPVTINNGIENATMLYRSKFVQGGTILENQDPIKGFEFDTPEKVVVPVKDYSNSYLVTLTTSNVNFADTTEDVYASFEYMAIDGSVQETEEYSLRELCREFYGYNPGVAEIKTVTDDDKEGALLNEKFRSGKMEVSDTVISWYKTLNRSVTNDYVLVDAQYNWCMRAGGSMSFLLDLPNLDHFTGMSVRLGENCTDDWQMDSINISRVYKYGRRQAIPVDMTIGGIAFNRVYTRNVTAQTVCSCDTPVYIYGGVTESVNLDENTFSTETERRNMSEHYYSMDYETATSELHFDQSAWQYEVRVNVQKNSNSDSKTDDCGSDNLFYFQLVFEQGTSGYVLANQQLKNDGFRSGAEETFNILINENLGELVSINIIPDDITKDATEFDKLCIDYIEVIKKNPDSANKLYVFNNIGWIDIEYADDAESNSTEGRFQGEIVKSFSVDYSTFMVSYEFSLSLDSYTDGKNNQGEQYEGGMTCDIVYHNSSGERKTLSNIDVVNLMYEYAGRQGKKDEVYGYYSDTSFMFRGQHINRFIVDIDDVAYFDSITFTGMPKSNCWLNINGIAVKLLKSDGRVIINSNGDFEKIYTVDPAVITSEITGRTFPHIFNFYAGTKTSYRFNFGTNEVPKLENEEDLKSVVSREPESKNDTLNLYVYMQEGVKNPTDGKYDLQAKISYSSLVSSNTYVNVCSKFKSKVEDGRTVVYAQGLTATNINMLTNLTLTTPNLFNDRSVKVDHAVVQQVRSGVVINTYTIRFNSTMISMNGGVSMASKQTAAALGTTQKVALLLGEGTDSAKLVPEEYDIALAIKYTSSTSGEDTELKSPYVFASDSGILSIRQGSIVEFEFDEAYVDKITGVEVIAMNGLSVGVECGNVVCTTTDDEGETTVDGWFSMDVPATVGISATTLEVTSTKAEDYNSLKRANFTFTTMEEASVVDSAGTVPIKMIISYKDNLGSVSSKVIEDIRPYVSGGFKAGEDASVSFFLSGAKALNYVELIPCDEDAENVASWNLEKLSFSLEGSTDSSEHTMPVERTIYEDGDTYQTDGNINNYINLSNIKMGLKRTIAGTSTFDDSAVQSIDVAAGTTLEVAVSISGGTSSYYGYYYDKVTGGNVENITSYTENFGPISYTFENSTTETQVYRLTVFARENPAMKVVMNVNVTPVKVENDIPDTPPATDPTDDNNQTENTENTDNTGDSNTDANNETNNEANNTPADTPSGDSETPASDNEPTGDEIGAAKGKTTKKKEEEDEIDA